MAKRRVTISRRVTVTRRVTVRGTVQRRLVPIAYDESATALPVICSVCGKPVAQDEAIRPGASEHRICYRRRMGLPVL